VGTAVNSKGFRNFNLLQLPGALSSAGVIDGWQRLKHPTALKMKTIYDEIQAIKNMAEVYTHVELVAKEEVK
jgi:hypothetical protein